MRKLDEARVGLLIRMSYHRACICAKKIQAPLVNRGYTKNVRDSTYELTPEGKREAARLIKEYAKIPIRTWGGISIGTEVMIVKH